MNYTSSYVQTGDEHLIYTNFQGLVTVVDKDYKNEI